MIFTETWTAPERQKRNKVNFLQNIFYNLFPQVQQAEQNLQTVGVIIAAWGLVIALELVLVIMLLARRR